MIRVMLSQLTCLYQLCLVMGSSVMCGFLGSYFLFRVGSDGFAILDGGCEAYDGGEAMFDDMARKGESREEERVVEEEE